LGGEKADFFADVGRRDEDSVDGVDDTVLGFLMIVSHNSSVEIHGNAHKVDGNDLAVKVYAHAGKPNTGSKSLRIVA
jgi:hypothetical protein